MDKKERKENRVLKRQYKKMMRKFRRELIKESKQVSPWDYRFGLDYFIKFLEFMLAYYELGYNVWGYVDINEDGTEPDYDIRIKTIKEALDEYNKFLVEYDGFETEYNKDTEFTIGDKTFTAIASMTVKFDEEDYAKHRAKRERHWQKFWVIVRKNILDWWD